MSIASVFRSKVFWIIAIPVLLLGLYALFGFKLAPGLVRSQAQSFVRETWGRELAIGEVRIHPFKLHIEVRDIALPDRDGTRMLAAERLYADFQIDSLWTGSYHFRELLAEEPFLHPVVRPDGSLNLAELEIPEDPEEAEEPLPSVLIDRFELQRGALDYLDQARRKPYRKLLEPLDLVLNEFRTTPEGGQFRLEAHTDNAERIEWQGRVRLEPEIASTGEFLIDDLHGRGVGEFLAESLPFDIAEGTIDLGGSYETSLGEVFQLDVRLPEIAMQAMQLRSREADPVVVDMPQVRLSDTVVSLKELRATIARLVISGMSTETVVDEYGSILLMHLLEPPQPVGADPGAVGATPAPATTPASDPASPPTVSQAPTEEWSVEVASLELDDARIGITDQMLVPGTRFELAPIDLTMSPFTTDFSKPIPVRIETRIDGEARLAASGELSLEPYRITGEIELEGMGLRKLQPYALEGMDLQVRAGTLSTKGRIALEPPEADGPELRFSGDLNIQGLKTVDNALERDFVNARAIEVSKLDYAMAPDSVEIGRVTLRKPYANVILASNQVLNLAAVIDPEGTAKALAEREAQARSEAAQPKSKRRKEPSGRKKGAKEAPPPPTSTYVEGVPIRVRELRLVDGTVDFADYFVQPNFEARILALNGSVTGMSSKASSRAKLALEGNVGRFSPVTIAGELQPFAFDRYTDVEMKFENINLPIFNPYSGKFAGYNIAKGTLSTELDYLIQNRKLDAKHKIRIDQLEWGEKTATQGEATLPVRLATSLLKDRNGTIALDLPVTGTLDDPKFRIGPIIWQIIKNILTKVVTAPFALFGSLAEGAEQAQFVDFEPGDATIPEASVQSLQALAAGLRERPEIRLDVPVAAVAELDRPAIEQRTWERALAEGWRKATGAAEEAPMPAWDTLDEARRIDVLWTAIESRTGVAPSVPPPPAPPEGTKRKEAKALARQAELQYLETTARALVVVDEAELKRLAEERGAAIQAALLTDTQLDPKRVFLTTAGKAEAHEGKVRFELGIE